MPSTTPWLTQVRNAGRSNSAVDWVHAHIAADGADVTLGTPVIRQRLQAPEINIGKWRIPIGFVTGTTAEWVAERPRNLQDDTYLYPLPDFDNVPFTSALVTSTTGSRDFRPARVIRMVECGDEGVEVISRTEVASFPDGTFRVGPGIEAKMGG